MTERKRPDAARLSGLVARQRRELESLRAEAAARSVVDLARGMLMEQLGCTPAEAQRQLARLARESGTGVVELAAQITRKEPPDAAAEPGLHRISLAGAVMETAAEGGALAGALLDEVLAPLGAVSITEPGLHRISLAGAMMETAAEGNALAGALLDEVLAPLGAVAVAVWLTEPDGGLELIGQAGFGPREASRWRRIPPDMAALPLLAARDAAETWWPSGPPAGDDRPLIGAWRGGARAVLPLQDMGVLLGSMAICWPEPLGEFGDPLRRQLTALADVTAQALGLRVGEGGQAADHRAAWIFSLLDGLLDGCMFARAVRDPGGRVTDFRIDHVSEGFRDPAGHGAADLAGGRLLELYPEAATAGGLFDRCLAVLDTGEPQQLSGEAGAAQAGDAGETEAAAIRIARLYDGVVIARRQFHDADRLAALLGHAQRLGRIGGWEENVRSGEVNWTEATFALFGMLPGEAVRVADLPSHVLAEDIPVVRGFHEALLHGRMESTAAFRVIRADDGSVRQIRAYGEPVTGPGGTVIAMRGVYQDTSADYHTRLAFAATREELADTQVRAEEEHRLAIRLQEAITPRSAEPAAQVEASGLDVAAKYRPSGPGNLVSGDWYDTVLLPSKHVLLVVGDIAGHGLDAVTGMVAVRNSLRGLAITGAGPAALLDWLNGAACHFTDGVIGTAVCGLYDPATRTLRWARAGHLPPILVRDGTARLLAMPEGLLLGADLDARYEEETIPLRLGDTLLLFTDGLIERRDEPIDDALGSLLRLASRPVGDIGRYADDLLAQAASNTGDDACLVAVRVR